MIVMIKEKEDRTVYYLLLMLVIVMVNRREARAADMDEMMDIMAEIQEK